MQDVTGAVAGMLAKTVPPSLPERHLRRPALEERIAAGVRRQVCVVVASAGFGKTTSVAAATDGLRSVAWYHLDASDRSLATLVPGLVEALRVRVPDLDDPSLTAGLGALGPEAESNERSRAQATAAVLAEALRGSARRDVVLVLDDLHELSGAEGSLALVEALCRQGPLHVVLISRSPVPFPLERLHGRGEVAEVRAEDLALTNAEVGLLLEGWCGADALLLAPKVAALTGGWPVAVRLAAEALARAKPEEREGVLARVAGASGTLQRYLVHEVLDAEDPATRGLLEVLAALPEVSVGLCSALGIRNAALQLEELGGRGLFLQPGSRAGWFRAAPLVREVFGQAGDDGARRRLREDALEWLEAEGPGEQALAVAVDLGDGAAIARVLARHGQAALGGGRVDLVVRACELVGDGERAPALDQLHGQALQVLGRWEEALARFERAAGGAERMPAGVAWRTGMLHYFRGALPEALAAFAQADRDGRDPVAEAFLAAWESAAWWRSGDTDAAERSADAALRLASATGDEAALASAHTALAMVAAARGDRRANDAHYLQALEHAERAGDALQTIRIRTNRASFFLEEGAFAEALAECDAAASLADLTGYATFHSLALVNRAEALLHLGRLDEAHADTRTARAIEQRLRSMDVRYPLLGLGDLYRLRGDRSLARSAYREALRLSEEAGDQQSLVPTLAGLARVLVDDDPDRGLELAERALDLAAGMNRCTALLALAVVWRARGDLERVRDLARLAHEEALDRRDRPAMAEALELAGHAEPERIRALRLIDEARAIWVELGSPIGALRALLASGRVSGGLDGEQLAAHAEAELHAMGAHGIASCVPASAREAPAVEIHSLGGFQVLRGGVVVLLTEWQSRKARDLLKLLVARRGRATPREVLMAALWPDEPPQILGNRLSVALSTVRGVLDPGKQHPGDHYVRTAQDAVFLDLDRVAVDVEEFLTSGERGLELVRQGRGDEGVALLEAVEPRYRGDFLEEDLYEEWAANLREQARAVYVSMLRALAEAAAGRGDHDGAVRRYLRILERDPYDEPAHLALVRTLRSAGRHGEARRAYSTYAGRMDELGLEAAPFPT